MLEWNALQELNAALLPQDTSHHEDQQPPWWARHILSHRDEWYGCALADDDEAGDEKIFLMLFAHQTARRVWFLEGRERYQVIGPGAMVRGHDEDAPAAYRDLIFQSSWCSFLTLRFPSETTRTSVCTQARSLGGLSCAPSTIQ